MGTSARTVARRAGDHPVIEGGARLGYAASGLLHLVLAWLTLQLVIGHASASANQTGAMAELARTAVGRALLWALLAGFVLLGLWQITEAVARHGTRRTKPAAKAMVYAALAFSTVSVLQGSSGNSNQQARSATARLMSQPAGVWLVGVVGAVIVAVGVFHVVKGARADALHQLLGLPAGPALVVAIAVGFACYGLYSFPRARYARV